MTDSSHEALLRPWYKNHPHFTVGGSLHAVPGNQRAATAAALTANQCRVHADIIVDGSGEHLGVTWAELADVRIAAPDARLDLHVIVPDELTSELAAELLSDVTSAARRFGVEAITLDATQIASHRPILDALRPDDIELWVELSPRASSPEIPAEIDGAVIMFITPGTQELANPAMLHHVTRLAPRIATAVDGGITEELAAQCVANGARYVVAGRSLLTAANPTVTSPTERRVHP